MCFNRSGIDCPLRFRIVSASRSSRVSPTQETTANPVTRVPGSTPSTMRAERAAGRDAPLPMESSHFFLVNIEVCGDVLHVVVFFECFHQLQQLLCFPARHLHCVLRHHLQ